MPRCAHGLAITASRVYLEREGIDMSWYRMLSLWREAGLQVPKKLPRRRAVASRPRPSETGTPTIQNFLTPDQG